MKIVIGATSQECQIFNDDGSTLDLPLTEIKCKVTVDEFPEVVLTGWLKPGSEIIIDGSVVKVEGKDTDEDLHPDS